MTREMGQRLAADASTIQGVTRAVVCDRDGSVLGANGDAEPHRAAALGAFLGGRGEAMTQGGDLRGLGRVLSESRLREVRVTGANGDVIVVESGQGRVVAGLNRGGANDATGSALRSLVQRYEDVAA
ncbi:MAG: hypothetical protein U0547_11990 [Dehalococcoidia bacterium]